MNNFPGLIVIFEQNGLGWLSPVLIGSIIIFCFVMEWKNNFQ